MLVQTIPFPDITSFLSFIDFSLIFTITAFTWVTLFYVASRPKRWVKILISQVIAVVCCIIWYNYVPESKNIKNLILNAALSILAYEWLIKAILEKLGLSNYNTKGIIGKKNKYNLNSKNDEDEKND